MFTEFSPNSSLCKCFKINRENVFHGANNEGIFVLIKFFWDFNDKFCLPRITWFKGNNSILDPIIMHIEQQKRFDHIGFLVYFVAFSFIFLENLYLQTLDFIIIFGAHNNQVFLIRKCTERDKLTAKMKIWFLNHAYI